MYRGILLSYIYYDPPKTASHQIISISTEETYNATLNSVKQSFPQYVRELEGIADGAQVEFHKVSKIIKS